MDIEKIKKDAYLITEVPDNLREEGERPFRGVPCQVIYVDLGTNEVGVTVGKENRLLSPDKLWTVEGYVRYRQGDHQPKFVPGSSRERQMITLLGGLLSRIDKEGLEMVSIKEVIHGLREKDLVKEDVRLMEIIPAINFFK